MKETWHKSQNSNSVKPLDRDETSSNVYIYLRKDFKLIPEKVENETVIPEHWEYMETQVLKEVAELLNMTEDNVASIADIENAICEITTMMTGV